MMEKGLMTPGPPHPQGAAWRARAKLVPKVAPRQAPTWCLHALDRAVDRAVGGTDHASKRLRQASGRTNVMLCVLSARLASGVVSEAHRPSINSFSVGTCVSYVV